MSADLKTRPCWACFNLVADGIDVCPHCSMPAEFRHGMRLARMLEADIDCAIQKLQQLSQFAATRGMTSTVAVVDSVRLVQLGKAATAVKQIADVFIADVRNVNAKGRA